MYTLIMVRWDHFSFLLLQYVAAKIFKILEKNGESRNIGRTSCCFDALNAAENQKRKIIIVGILATG